MKKIITCLVATLCAIGFSQAQEDSENLGFSKGDTFVSGAVGFGSQSDGDFESSSFEFSPSLGYFLGDHFALGIQLGFTTSTESRPFESDLDSNELNVGVFGRYYATPSNKFSLFAQLGVGYLSSNLEQGSFSRDGNGLEVSLNPGFSYFVSENFALEASVAVLNYATFKIDEADDSANAFNFGIDMSDVNLGVVYKF